MTARIPQIASLILVPALFLHGQSAGVAGPVAGYVFDNAMHGLRPILGTPGASLIGSPVDFGFPVAAVSVAPRQDSAFVTASDGTFHLFRIGSGAPAEIALNGMASAQRVVFSPSGQAASLYAMGSVQIIGGLPGAPAIVSSVDVSAAGAPAALAVSDDAAVLLVASQTSVELYGSGADLGQVVSTAGAALLAFAPGRQDAAIVDAQGAGVLLIPNLLNGPAPQVIAATDSTIQAASGLAFSPDGAGLFLASSSAQSVTSFDLTAGARNAIPCSCSPSTLARVGDWFRLNDLGQEPLWLLDAQPTAARILFVPATGLESRRRPVESRSPRPFEGRRSGPSTD